MAGPRRPAIWCRKLSVISSDALGTTMLVSRARAAMISIIRKIGAKLVATVQTSSPWQGKSRGRRWRGLRSLAPISSTFKGR